jgi:4-aminobutyrate aminotransferase-like enzyme
VLNEYRKYVAPVFKFQKPIFVRGEGSYVWDQDGNRLLDVNAGQFCSILGHSHPKVAETVSKLAVKLQNTSSMVLSEEVLYAAKRMHDICKGMDSRLLLLATGGEANECCMRYAKHLTGNKVGVISFDKGYHGLTLGTESSSIGRQRVKPAISKTFQVPVPPVYYDDEKTERIVDKYLNEFEEMVKKNHQDIALTLFEPILSTGGMYFPPAKYFKRVKEVCKQYNILLTFDECQTGFGRTGTWFYYEQLDCIPDMVVCAKGIGLGYPVSAVIFNGKIVPENGFIMSHFSSHQNDPFSAGIVSFGIDYITQNNIISKNKEKGDYLIEQLDALSKKYKVISDVRGKGLMCAFDISSEVKNYKELNIKMLELAMQRGLILQACNDYKSIRLLPNYEITYKEIDCVCDIIEQTIKEIEEG